ncbi:hypothetical protein BDV25DRAFT_25294 [Aspergillus avenaceus]|uniref:Uncharacterized protein n=1 Tax=Aspergillus avenaceus TaxID=36643 RepID=A0A5N6TNS8_ASPAV|nr:hypothetical protein BDV25DRAFT_25294 [Aspergillus avenaceus]
MDTFAACNKTSSESLASLSAETTSKITTGQGTQSAPIQPSTIELYERFRSYPFHADRQFGKGLAIILGHPDVPASEAEISRNDDLILQAKCFYFSRKEKMIHPINPVAYKAWLEPDTTTKSSLEIIDTSEQPDVSVTGIPPLARNLDQKPPPACQEPAYPSSFTHIVELITTGQPIPGIQQIPDTVLTGHDTSSTKPKRRKPWEKQEAF